MHNPPKQNPQRRTLYSSSVRQSAMEERLAGVSDWKMSMSSSTWPAAATD